MVAIVFTFTGELPSRMFFRPLPASGALLQRSPLSQRDDDVVDVQRRERRRRRRRHRLRDVDDVVVESHDF